MKKLMLVMIFISQLALAQQEINTEIANLLLSNIPVKDKIDRLNMLSKKEFKRNYQLFDSVSHIALDMSITEKYQLGEAKSYINLSLINEGLGKLSIAESQIKKAISILESKTLATYRPILAEAYLSMGHVMRRTGHKSEAVENFLKSLKIANESGNLSVAASAYRGLGIVYVLEKNFDKALNYYKQALAINKKINNKEGISANYTNIGIVYLRLKQYEKSLAAHKIALKLSHELKDESRIAFIYNDIGAVSLYKGDLDNALLYLKKSIAIREKLAERNEIAYTYNYLGETYNKLGDFIKAEQWIQKALSTAVSIGNNKQHYEALESLSDFYANNKKYDKAYEYLSKYKLYRDSIGKIEGKNAMEELVIKYETEKKEQEIQSLSQRSKIQKLEIQRKNIFLAIAFVTIVFIGLTSYLVYNRRKLKAKSQLQKEINKQQDLAAKAVLEAEERERRRIAGDLHDGVGQILSAALMNLNSLFDRLKIKDEAADKTLDLVKDSYDEIRSISHQMMPNALIKSGLAFAIKEFLSKIDRDKLNINLETSGLNQRLDEQLETVLYRIVQECVNNVIKHANADKLTIQLLKDEDGVAITIEDNGDGFDKNKANFTDGGIGISNIYSRVAFLKGTVDIDSAVGKGTLVAIHIPN